MSEDGEKRPVKPAPNRQRKAGLDTFREGVNIPLTVQRRSPAPKPPKPPPAKDAE